MRRSLYSSALLLPHSYLLNRAHRSAREEWIEARQILIRQKMSTRRSQDIFDATASSWYAISAPRFLNLSKAAPAYWTELICRAVGRCGRPSLSRRPLTCNGKFAAWPGTRTGTNGTSERNQMIEIRENGRATEHSTARLCLARNKSPITWPSDSTRKIPGSRMQAAVHQGVLGCVALVVVADFCVSRPSHRSTFCFFSAPGTLKYSRSSFSASSTAPRLSRISARSSLESGNSLLV